MDESRCGQLIAALIFVCVALGAWLVFCWLVQHMIVLVTLGFVGYFAWQALLCWARNDDNMKP